MKQFVMIVIGVLISIFLTGCKAEQPHDEIQCPQYTILEGDLCVPLPKHTIHFVVPDLIDDVESIQVTDGLKATLPVLDIPFDYEWYTDADFAHPYDLNTIVNEDDTLYIKLDTTFTVTFVVPDDMEPIPAVEVDYLSRVSQPLVETTRKYAWYSDERINLNYSFTHEITEDTTIYLRYYPMYKVSFVGVEGMDPIPSQMVEYGDSATPPELDITREYRWYTDSSMEQPYSFLGTISRDTTLYIGLEPLQYYVRTWVNGEYRTIAYDDPLELSNLEEPDIFGYSFAGWYIDEERTVRFNPQELVQYELYPITNLYADMESITKTVTYVIDGEVYDSLEFNVAEGINQDYPSEVVPTYAFTGWYTDSELTNPIGLHYYPEDNVTVYGEVHIYEYETLKDLYDYSENGDVVVVRGVVVKILFQSVLIYDGEGFLRIPTWYQHCSTSLCGSEYESIVDLELGMEVEFLGNYQYNNYPGGLTDIHSYTIMSTDNELPSDFTYQSISGLYNSELYGDTTAGELFSVEGIIRYDTESGYIILESYDRKLYFDPVYTTHSGLSEVVQKFQGQTVVLHIFSFGYNSESTSSRTQEGVYVGYYNPAVRTVTYVVDGDPFDIDDMTIEDNYFSFEHFMNDEKQYLVFEYMVTTYYYLLDMSFNENSMFGGWFLDPEMKVRLSSLNLLQYGYETMFYGTFSSEVKQYATVTDLYENVHGDPRLYVNGIITYITDEYAVINDGMNTLIVSLQQHVYSDDLNSYQVVPISDLAVGMEVELYGYVQLVNQLYYEMSGSLVDVLNNADDGLLEMTVLDYEIANADTPLQTYDINMTLEDLINNGEDYIGQNITITGVLTPHLDFQVYLEDGEYSILIPYVDEEFQSLYNREITITVCYIGIDVHSGNHVGYLGSRSEYLVTD